MYYINNINIFNSRTEFLSYNVNVNINYFLKKNFSENNQYLIIIVYELRLIISPTKIPNFKTSTISVIIKNYVNIAQCRIWLPRFYFLCSCPSVMCRKSVICNSCFVFL